MMGEYAVNELGENLDLDVAELVVVVMQVVQNSYIDVEAFRHSYEVAAGGRSSKANKGIDVIVECPCKRSMSDHGKRHEREILNESVVIQHSRRTVVVSSPTSEAGGSGGRDSCRKI